MQISKVNMRQTKFLIPCSLPINLLLCILSTNINTDSTLSPSPPCLLPFFPIPYLIYWLKKSANLRTLTLQYIPKFDLILTTSTNFYPGLSHWPFSSRMLRLPSTDLPGFQLCPLRPRTHSLLFTLSQRNPISFRVNT